ncbi:long-chain-fatty-acid--CoA ligase [Salimicrobium humidisoli]|uniref:Long-chain fatty acid--CoA ligase n=1 Tax=Salimicrobium humidisoli TaxID=2029857 RepID=A0ABX4HV72_9BACI|nr:long-chain-fatty-acid--CoA ligase [Salimicrobium humidisoli]PBB07099.1 long-chain fatty acid--CoA ligase [Salimicrobium humidisoli]
MGPTLKSMFDQTAAKFPEREGLADERINVRWTYGEWKEEVNRFAHTLQDNGISKGDVVSTVLFNTSEFMTVLFACARLGAVFNPINFRLTEKEIAFILADAEPKVVVYERATSPQVDPVQEDMTDVQFWSIDEKDGKGEYLYSKLSSEVTNVETELDEDDTYAIMYTSGTTGKPKGVLHTHRDMVDQAMAMALTLRLTAADKGLSIGPMFHCAELHCAIFPRILVGAGNAILHHYDPKETIRLVREEGITTMFGAPTMWHMMIQEEFTKEDITTLRQGLYGGAPMPPSLTRELYDVLGIGLVQAYGMTEMGPAITVQMEDEQIKKAGSAGKPLVNQEIRIIRSEDEESGTPDDICAPGELGEIIVRGPSMMKGYYKRPEATEKSIRDGWYYSGDVGMMDEEGYLWVRDRVKDMIISGGENIYSREVEDALSDHPAVEDAAVVGEPDAKWGEQVVAFIVKKEEVTAQEIDEFLLSGNRLSRYKRPKRYEFVEELPRNASGKLQKFKLREEAVKTK